METLLAEAEHFYGQAYYRYLAIQQQTREDVEGALPGLGQTSTAPEQVHALWTPVFPAWHSALPFMMKLYFNTIMITQMPIAYTYPCIGISGPGS